MKDLKNFLTLAAIAALFVLLGAAAFGVGPLAPIAGPIHQGLMMLLSGGN